MAFDEHFIDLVNRLPAVAGRTARPERQLELRTLRLLPSRPPAGQTPGLARQILERELEGLEPPGEAFGIDEAIRRRGGIGYGRARWRQSIIREEMDTRGIPRERSAARAREVFPRIEELKGGTGVPALPDWPAGIGIGREGAGFTTRPRAAWAIETPRSLTRFTASSLNSRLNFFLCT